MHRWTRKGLVAVAAALTGITMIAPSAQAGPGMVDIPREVLDCIEGLLAEGLRHGFFNYSIRCEIGRDGRRQLIIEAGKSHKFTIPKDEVSH